jgi:hypothetical protein
MKTVHLDREKMKNFLRPLFREAIKKRLESNAWSHVNKDNYLSPSEWWFDINETIRHSLQTGISAELNGNTITVNLTYEVQDITQPTPNPS